jgi:hypothetical protein
MRVSTAIGLLVLCLASPVAAQSQQLRVLWNASPDLGAATPAFAVIERRALTTGPARQRNPELSSDQVVVRTYDAGGRLVHTQLVPDPRVVRAEVAQPDGALSGERLNRTATELLLTVPDSPPPREIRLFHPRWTGTAFALEPLGVIPLD